MDKQYITLMLILIFITIFPSWITYIITTRSITNTYVHDSREGTIACDNAQSIIHKEQVYCLTIVDTD